MKCRLCSSIADEVMCFDRVPPNVQALLTKDTLGTIKPTQIKVHKCSGCGLVQIPWHLTDSYYDDYLMSTTFSSQLAEYLDGLVEEFVNTYHLQNAKVLDIGCGDGAFMYPFQRRNIAVEGIEPSDKSRAISTAAGFTVYSGYMTPDTQLATGPYDAFVTRQVLEHVDSIQDFLTGIRRQLKPGAVGIVEIPRLEKALADRRFYDFFPDHLNYFSLDTLRIALELNGFDVLDLRGTMKDEYNIAIVRLRSSEDFVAVVNNINNLTQQLEKLFKEYKNQGKTTAIWGAGAKGLSIMTAMNTSNLDIVVDSDINKQGYYTPISEFLIQEPAALKNVNVVVITAVAYQTVIVEKLKNTYNYSGDVFLICADGIKQINL